MRGALQQGRHRRTTQGPNNHVFKFKSVHQASNPTTREESYNIGGTLQQGCLLGYIAYGVHLCNKILIVHGQPGNRSTYHPALSESMWGGSPSVWQETVCCF